CSSGPGGDWRACGIYPGRTNCLARGVCDRAAAGKSCVGLSSPRRYGGRGRRGALTPQTYRERSELCDLHLLCISKVDRRAEEPPVERKRQMTRRTLALGISAGSVALLIISWSLVRSNAPERQHPEGRSAADNAAPTQLPTVLVA